MVLKIEDQPLPPLPGQIALEELSPGRPVVPIPFEAALSDGRSSVPVIRLAHDDPEEDFYYDEDGFAPRLSKIIEVSEPSEISTISLGERSPSHSLARRSTSSSAADYGQVVRESNFFTDEESVLIALKNARYLAILTKLDRLHLTQLCSMCRCLSLRLLLPLADLALPHLWG